MLARVTISRVTVEFVDPVLFPRTSTWNRNGDNILVCFRLEPPKQRLSSLINNFKSMLIITLKTSYYWYSCEYTQSVVDINNNIFIIITCSNTK